MKNLSLVFVVLLCSMSCFAQTIFSNAVWHYGTNGYAPHIFYSTQVKAQNDTVISGNVFTAFDLYLGHKPNRIYLREQYNTIYYHFRNREFTLFDFNASVGDTLVLDILSDYSNIDTTLLFEDQKVLIKEIHNVENPLTGEPLKRFVYEFIDLDRGENQYGITEHILHERTLTGNIFSLIDDQETVGGIHFIRCFESDTFSFKDIGFYQSQKTCDWTNVGIEEFNRNPKLSLTPNPATSSISLPKNDYETVSIYDNLGQLVYFSDKPSNIIDITSLKSGIYFMYASKNNEHSYGRFIK